MQFSTFLIDLDDTLYPASCNLWPLIRERMSRYMHDRLGLDWATIPDLRRRLYLEYGTTLRGLQATRHVDAEDFLAYVHDLPLADYLSPDPALRQVLRSFPQRKFIFTNADRHHAARVMAILGVEDCFDGIIDILDLTPYCKPMPEAFSIALQRAGESDPRRCLLVDDAPRNLGVARELGIFPVLVGAAGADADSFAAIPRLADLAQVAARAAGDPA